MGDSKASETRAPLDPSFFSDINGDNDVHNEAPIDSVSSNSTELGSSVSENQNLEDASSSRNQFLVHDPGSSQDPLDGLQDQNSDPLDGLQDQDSGQTEHVNLQDVTLDRNSDQTEHALSVQSETPRAYVAPRITISHQDSFSEDSRADHHIDDAQISSGSPRAEMSNANENVTEDSQAQGTQEVGLPRLRVPGSPRAFVYQRTVGSPSRFGSPIAIGSPMNMGTPNTVVGTIDNSAPFESVKEAVSKFGGITDWKAHKIQAIERRKFVDQELEKIQEDIPEYKKQAEVAEEAKQQVVKELESTKRLVEELKLELEKAQKEERQAKQDSELAKLRVEEMEQGIADEASVAAKTQLEVAKARHSSAVSELTSVKEELETVHKEFDDLLKEKDLAVKKAVDAMSESKEMERKMEGLTIELIATKESLESAHTAHLEAEEKKFSAVMARDQDVYNWEKELKMVEEDIERLNQEIQLMRDTKIKLETASAHLHDLKAELAAYKEKSKSSGEKSSTGDFLTEKRSQGDIQAAVDSAKIELEEVKSNIEKATSEVNGLKITASSLQSEVEKVKLDLAEAKQREAEQEQMSSVQKKDKEEKEEVVELPEKLQQAAKEADEAKSLAKAAREELRKAKEESDQAKAEVKTIETKLVVAKKEMEAAKASEKLALAAIKALQESKSAQKSEDTNSPRSIVISVEEYYELSKRAHVAEEAANTRLADLVSQVEAAKEEESRSLEKLEEVNRVMSTRKEELKVAMEKAEKAREGKLGVEQELRKWRAENGERKKAGEEPEKSPKPSVEARDQENNLSQSKDVPLGSYTPRPITPSGNGSSNVEANSDPAPAPETKKKKKKLSLLPKVFMFLSRKKSNK